MSKILYLLDFYLLKKNIHIYLPLRVILYLNLSSIKVNSPDTFLEKNLLLFLEDYRLDRKLQVKNFIQNLDLNFEKTFFLNCCEPELENIWNENLWFFFFDDLHFCQNLEH